MFYLCSGFIDIYVVSGGLYHLESSFLLLGLPAAIYVYVCVYIYFFAVKLMKKTHFLK